MMKIKQMIRTKVYLLLYWFFHRSAPVPRSIADSVSRTIEKIKENEEFSKRINIRNCSSFRKEGSCEVHRSRP